jgi:hypothetical protein
MPGDERVVSGKIRTTVLPTKEGIAKGDLEIEEIDRGGVNVRAKRQFNDPLHWYARPATIPSAAVPLADVPPILERDPDACEARLTFWLAAGDVEP